MYPRQSLTPRCSAKPARHPAHPDVDPHAVFKTQLALRLKKTPQAEMLPSGHGNSTTSQHHSGCSWRCAVFVRNSSCLQSREVGPVATQARKCCSGSSHSNNSGGRTGATTRFAAALQCMVSFPYAIFACPRHEPL